MKRQIIRITLLTVMCIGLLPRQSDAGILSFLADLFGGAGRVVAGAAEAAGRTVSRATESMGRAVDRGPRLLASGRDFALPTTYTATKRGWRNPTALGATRRDYMAAREAVSSPKAGKQLNLTLGDSRFPAKNGWVKMEQMIAPKDLRAKFDKAHSPQRVVTPTVVHYNRNTKTGQVMDPKVRDYKFPLKKKK